MSWQWAVSCSVLPKGAKLCSNSGNKEDNKENDMDNMHTQNVKQYRHGRQSLHTALSIRMQIPWGTALAHAVHLQVNVATVANAGFQLPEACVTGNRHTFSEKRAYTLPPHSQSHDVRNLNIVIALTMLAGSELTSEGVTRTRKSLQEHTGEQWRRRVSTANVDPSKAQSRARACSPRPCVSGTSKLDP